MTASKRGSSAERKQRSSRLANIVDQTASVGNLLQHHVQDAAHPASPHRPAISAQSLCRADATLSNPDG